MRKIIKFLEVLVIIIFIGAVLYSDISLCLDEFNGIYTLIAAIVVDAFYITICTTVYIVLKMIEEFTE